MALTLAEAQAAFKKIGKLVFIANSVAQNITDLKTAAMGTVDQTASGLANEFDTHQKVVVPLNTQINNLINALAGLPTHAKNGLLTFFTVIMWPGEMDMATPTPSLAAFGTELVSQMTAVGAHVAVGGTFATYFQNSLGITLPTNAAPSILDAWVTAAVV